MILTKYIRRVSHEVKIGLHTIGGSHPIAVQSMTNTDTADTQSSVDQTLRIERAGAPIVRLTAQGRKEGENLRDIVSVLRDQGSQAAIVADIHFTPEVAAIAANYVDKVRINPGNYRLDGGDFEALMEQCRQRGVALRVGVNHGSLSKRIFDEWGDTPQGMVAAAMEFLERCRAAEFSDVVVSMKSSNTRVMLYAYRLLCEAMEAEGMTYPIHLGVTEAGNDIEGRVKSAVGIGALLSDGIGDTLRVSLTEAPENEVPVAVKIVDHFASREGEFEILDPSRYSPTEYRRRSNVTVPIIHTELTDEFTIIESVSKNPSAELRAAILNLGDDRPVVVKARYEGDDMVDVAVRAAADLGVLFLDGLADGIIVDAPQLSPEQRSQIELLILQASRVRQSQTEYIACPSCGRTLFDIEQSLAQIKAATSHLSHLKIGVMGCIVNGPGEMADADYGYVGAAPGRITLYKGRTLIERNIPQGEAIERLIELIKSNGDWVDCPVK
ncbi:MAG: (E)-4-hydroxy-3-methylbut-2-enyl-diphosphate synthase [Rikenellaceae bacterium]